MLAAVPVLPTGGKVVAGSANIGAPSGGSLSINQSSSKAIIDWNGFSVGAGGKVQFNNGSGATLNRVTGAQLSSLDGLLSGTGSIYLINPNGVIIGKSGVVTVGGTFVASTLDTSNAGFLTGGPLSFTGASSAAVVNYGKVGALGGDVALIAAKVDNAGAINAANGDAGLLAGYKVVLKDASLDDGRFSVELGETGTSVTNSGLIAAADAELRAEQGNVYALAGDTAGVIRATGTKSGGGHVWLAAEGGTLDVAGVLEAQGANGAPGAIETSGSTVDLQAARVDAHGGTWLVDPDDLTIDATAALTIDNALNAGTSVTEQTTATGTSGAGTVNTAGNGDIIVAAPLTWNTNAGLTLSALRNVTLDPAGLITSSGGGAVTLQADNTGTGVGTVNFGLASAVSTSGAVTIFYNPVSYADAATRSTQSYGGGGQDSRNFVNPYTSDVTGGAKLTAYMLVNTLTQLEGINTELDGVYALTHDIDASSSATMNPVEDGSHAGWTPIGDAASGDTAFTGSLNGQGHIINGLYINNTTNGNGLFGYVGLISAITNLGLTNVNITSTGQQTGALAGYKDGYGELTNVYATGTVSGGFVTGGLVAELNGGINTNIYVNVNVTGTDVRTGGLIGQFDGDGASLTNAYATGSVTGTSVVGGLIAYINGSPNITNAYATGDVVGTTGTDIGGFVGLGGDGTITNAYATGNVTTSQGGDYVGGFVGQFDGDANNIYATGNVVSQSNEVGGLIGSVMRDAVIGDAYATGSVTSTGASVGGVVGELRGVVSTSYASGAVSGSGAVGGFVGDDYVNGYNASITDSYATGSVTGLQSGNSAVVNYVGGFAGYNSIQSNGSPTTTLTRDYATGLVSGVGTLGGFAGQNDGVITDSLWDRTSTGQTLGVGAPDSSNTGAGMVTNLTSVQDITPGAADYAFSTAPYTAAGFSFGTTPGGTIGLAGGGETWVQVDSDGSFNGAGGATVGTRPFLLMEYSPTITNAHQLQLIALAQTMDYALASNVDASSTATTAGMWGPGGFVPLGQTFYSGTFDGQGFSIAGLTITNSGKAGLFADLLGVVQNVNLAGGAIVGTGQSSVGALAANAASSVGAFPGSFDAVNGSPTGGRVVNSTSSASVVGNEDVGGLVGMSNSSITGSSSSGFVTALPVNITTTGGASGPTTQTYQPEYTGGLLGESLGATVTNAFASGAVSGGTFVGGLIGLYTAAGTPAGSIGNAFAIGAVSGSTGIGGLIGATSGPATITSSYATGSVTATGPGDGGLIGATQVYTNPLTGAAISNATVTDSYATGAVSGSTQVGGLVGDAEDLTTITGSAIGRTYASGSVTGVGAATATGGLVGENAGTITLASYVPTGAGVSGYSATGGLVGQDDPGATITNSFSTGTVTSFESYTGGLVGLSDDAMVTGSYATGVVSGGNDTGGLIGSAVGGATSGVSNSYATGNVTGQFVSVGGLVGSSTADISDSYATGAVTGAQQGVAGGLVGVLGFNGFNDAYSAATVLDSYATGAVSGQSYIGGLVGRLEAQSSITGSGPQTTYASGLVTSTGTAAGGLVGQNYGTITQAGYDVAGGRSVVGVTGAADVGGAVGRNEAGATLSDVSVFSGVLGTSYTGGIVGDNFGAVTGGGFGGAVTGGSGLGGIVGVNEGGASVTGTGGFQGNNTVVGTGNDVGGVAGANFGTLGMSGATVFSAGSVIGVDRVGGLVGYNSGTLVGSASNTVSGRDYVGGIVGLNYATVVGNASGTVNGGEYVGGVVGWNDTQGFVSSSSSIAYLTATGDYAGGLVGVNKGMVTGSAVGPANAIVGSVLGAGYVGGLVGLNRGSIGSSTASGAVSGSLYLGGLVGWNDTGATVTTSYATGKVTGIAGGQEVGTDNDYVGGLVGVNFGSIANSYATGAVSGVQVVGGLVGTNMPGGASVTTSYATGAVSASGGAVGTTFGVQAGEVSYVYGFPSLSGQPVENGYTNAGSTGGGTDLTAAQEDGSAAYAGFDFTNTWQANSAGPPTLKPQPVNQ